MLLAAPDRQLSCGLEGVVALAGVTKTACFVDPTAPGAPHTYSLLYIVYNVSDPMNAD